MMLSSADGKDFSAPLSSLSLPPPPLPSKFPPLLIEQHQRQRQQKKLQERLQKELKLQIQEQALLSRLNPEGEEREEAPVKFSYQHPKSQEKGKQEKGAEVAPRRAPPPPPPPKRMTLQEKWLKRLEQQGKGVKSLRGDSEDHQLQEEDSAQKQLQDNEASELSYKEWIEEQQRQQQVQIEAILRHQQQLWQQQLIQQLTQQQQLLPSLPEQPSHFQSLPPPDLSTVTGPSSFFPPAPYPPPLHFTTIPFSSTMSPSIPHHPLPPPPPSPSIASHSLVPQPSSAGMVETLELHQEPQTSALVTSLHAGTPPLPIDEDSVFPPPPPPTTSQFYPALEDLDLLQETSALHPSVGGVGSLSQSTGSHSSPTGGVGEDTSSHSSQYKSLHEEGSSQDMILAGEQSSSSGGRSLSCSSSGSSETAADEEDSRFEKCNKYTRPRQREKLPPSAGVASYPSLGAFLEEEQVEDRVADAAALTDISNSTSGSNGFATCSRNSTLSSIQSTNGGLVVNKAYQQQQQPQPRSGSSSSTSTVDANGFQSGRGSNGLPDSGSADGFTSALSRPQSSLVSSGQNLYQLQQQQLLELQQQLREEQFQPVGGVDAVGGVRYSGPNMNVLATTRPAVSVPALRSSSSSSFSSGVVGGARRGVRGSVGAVGTPPHFLGSLKRQAPAPPLTPGITTPPPAASQKPTAKLEPFRSAPQPPTSSRPGGEVASTFQRRRKSSSAVERGPRRSVVVVVSASRTGGPRIPPPPVTGRISRSTERPLKTIRSPSKRGPPPRPPRPKSSPPSSKRPSAPIYSKTLTPPGWVLPGTEGKPTPAAPPPSPSSCSSLSSRQSSLESYESEDEDRDPNASWSSSASSRPSSRCSSFSCSSYESSSVSSPSIPIIDLMLALLPV